VVRAVDANRIRMVGVKVGQGSVPVDAEVVVQVAARVSDKDLFRVAPAACDRIPLC